MPQDFQTKYDKKSYNKNRKQKIKYAIEYRKRLRIENPEKLKSWTNKYNKKPKNRFYNLIQNAKKRKIELLLTFDEFLKFWQKPCYYCGEKLETIGLDRVNNNLGYKLDNIVSCCKWCNQMKLNHTQNDFIEHCKIIIKYNQN